MMVLLVCNPSIVKSLKKRMTWNCLMVNTYMPLIALIVPCLNRDLQCRILYAGVLCLQSIIVGDCLPAWKINPRLLSFVTGTLMVVDGPNISSVISS